MTLARKLNPVVRSVGVMGAVAAMVTGVTFATMNGSASLVNNTISAQAMNDVDVLGIATGDDCDSAELESSVQGFAFDEIVVGEDPVYADGDTFCLENLDQDTDADDATRTVWLKIPTLPTFNDGAETPMPVSVAAEKVKLHLTCTGVAGFTGGAFTLADLNAGDGVDLGDLATGESVKCDAAVTVDEDAFTGENIESEGFDMVFSAVSAV